MPITLVSPHIRYRTAFPESVFMAVCLAMAGVAAAVGGEAAFRAGGGE